MYSKYKNFITSSAYSFERKTSLGEIGRCVEVRPMNFLKCHRRISTEDEKVCFVNFSIQANAEHPAHSLYFADFDWLSLAM